MVRRRVKVGHDRHGQYIRYRGQKIYLSQAIIKKGAKSGMDNLELLKWILKQLALRRRRRRRRARQRRSDLRSQKEYKNYAESKGFTGQAGPTGPKLPLSMTHIPTVLYERQRLLDRTREQKMLEDSKSDSKEIEQKRLAAPEIRKMLTHIADTGEIKKDDKDNIRFIDVNGAVTKIPRSHKLYSFAKGLYAENEEWERQARRAEAKAKGSEQKRKKAEADAITAKRKQLQTQLREKLKEQKTLQQDYKDVIDAADDAKSIEKIGDRDNLRAQLKDLGVKTGKGYPSKETVINALKARIEEITRHPEREEVTDKKKGTTKKLKEYIPIMKELRFYNAYVNYKKSLEEAEQDILTKKQELDSLTKESKQEESHKKATESTSTSKPKNATVPPKPKPKSEPDKLPPSAPEPLPSVTIEEVDDDDDTHLEHPEKKGPEVPKEELEQDSDLDDSDDTPAVKVPPPGVASTGDGSRNSKKSLKPSPPLDEHKINELMADIPGYLGTITKDEIPKLTKAAQKAWLAGTPFGWIHLTISRAQAVGNNKRPGEVGHWVAVAVVPDRTAVMYYDSFGRPTPVDVKTMLKAMFDKVAPREFLKFKENLIQEQSVNTNNCGWFSIKFLLDTFGGLEFTETTPWNRSVQAERDIEAFKKKFKPFSWL